MTSHEDYADRKAEIARDAGYADAAAMCRRLARQGQAYLASPYAAARDTLDALRAELTTPVPEWRGGTDPDSVTERRREALRGRPAEGGLMREPTRGG